MSKKSTRSSGGAESLAEQTIESLHLPVLRAETLHYLEPQSNGLFVDCTLGLGGHSEAILSTSPTVHVIGIDRDQEALEKARLRLAKFGSRFRSFHNNFQDIKTILADAGVTHKVTGVLADLGVSSLQLDAPTRGFSFRFDAPLDMRMNANSEELTAADLLATLPEEEIARVIYEYGEERFSRRIARRIVERRETGDPVITTKQLAELVERTVKANRRALVHPATRTFQALRIAVNEELSGLDRFLSDAVDLLQPLGKLVVISFHSLEDRIVKKTFRRFAGVCECPPRLPICQCGAVKRIEILTGRPVISSTAEIETNPRARSAKLRACMKLTNEEHDF